jgi:hypothetical protein
VETEFERGESFEGRRKDARQILLPKKPRLHPESAKVLPIAIWRAGVAGTVAAD